MPSVLSTIVVATDFSENAEKALQWAIALAGAHGARVVLVHAIEPAVSSIDLLEGPLHEEVRAGLVRAEQTAKAAGVRVNAESHRGRAWQVVADAAKRREADLIVLGTRGRTGYKRLLLGSTADRLIRTSSIPVLVIHPNDQPPKTGAAIKTVLVPVDFSEESSLATSMAARMLAPNREGGRIILLHTVELMVEWPTPEIPTVMPRYWDNAERDAGRQLETIAASLRSDALRVDVKTLRGYPPDAIEEQSKTGVDLIAMGTRGRSGLDRLMIGSVAERVIKNAGCPVLVVRHPGDKDPIRVSV